MRKILILIFIAAMITAAVKGYEAVRTRFRTDLVLNSKAATVYCKVADSLARIGEAMGIMKKGYRVLSRNITKAVNVALPGTREDAKTVTLYLKHGGVVSGELVSRSGGFYTVEWNGKQAVFSEKQIDRVERGLRRDAGWRYKNSVVVKKTNGIVIDGKIVDAGKDDITVSFDEGGGLLEMGIKRSEIDYLMFAPVWEKEDIEREGNLRKQFPKMKVYTEGNMTIFSDSHERSMALYRNTIRQAYTDIYINFFKLFKDRQPQGQNFIVMFDDIEDYWTYAATDGVPGWIAVGYFSPLNKVLYTYNGFGERMEKWVLDIVEGITGSFNKEVVDRIKNNIDQRYHIFLEGQAKEFTDRFWDLRNIYKSELLAQSLKVLRHEFTHEVFHNWGLQSITLVKPKMDSKKMLEKKKQIMDEKGWKKKKDLLEELMNMKEKTDEFKGLEREEIIEAGTAQSWLNEGMATYCETEPFGSPDMEWLFVYQEAAGKNELNPIEFFTNFKIGSFAGLYGKAVGNSYGQSWAFTTFLVNIYRDEFMDYQLKLVESRAKNGEKGASADELDMLLKCLNKDLGALEKEFREYMNTYPKAEDPDVELFMRYNDVWDKFYQTTTIGRQWNTRRIEKEADD